ncbi:MAG: squalene synthase HpnC [Betaproteobacteria bacterium]|nr:squalene synthase HpnC [Betaproteobacteria bacterium]
MPVDHYENFPVASLLLPRQLRHPVEVIYRFARSADDFADEGEDAPEVRLARLGEYRSKLGVIASGRIPQDPLFRDLAHTVAEHQLPLSLFGDLLEAFSQDVLKNRYADYTEVLEYCRRSANPVGRLLLHLFKRTSETQLRQSDAICTGLQLANFWQDVAVDWAKNRVYLPQDEMRRYGVGEAHLSTQRCDPAWRALMRHQCDRTRALLLQGAPVSRTLPGRSRWEIALTVQGGLRILDRLAAAGYDMFRRRPRLRWFDWPLLAWRAL